jgi:DNA-binding response OmpR family regulator
MKKILIVEDDININNMIYEALSKKEFSCTQSYSGTEGRLCIKNDKYDLVLLDLMLPGMKGEDFLKELRAFTNTPVTVVSAKDELDSKVDLLTLGADDYITKPLEIKELVARVLVQLRRNSNNKDEEYISYKEMKLNKSTYQVLIQNEDAGLTRQEFKIMELLLTYPSKVFSKQEIYNYAWEEYYIGEDKTINVHISNIRIKFKKLSDEEYIETVWGIGFKLA